ncbi:MAG: beta-lactamase family protein [Deltaproteobacteria bacterium]|nr:beta-lactamase family protein [Deltaproteobacteria bacterium]
MGVCRVLGWCRVAFGAAFLCGAVAGCDELAVDGADGSFDRDAGPVDAAPAIDARPPEDLDGFVEWQMDAGGLPGVAAGLVVDGEIAFVGTWGYADVENERPVADDTLFVVASVSKLFTAVPVMRLVEEGMLDLDVPTGEAFDFPIAHPGFPDDDITTRRLLTHTSGMVDAWITLGETTYSGDPPIDLGDFARGYAQPGGEYYQGSNFGPEPGTDWEYCNAAFAVAAHLAELGWGEDFRALSERMIFEPLALQDTGWHFQDIDESKLAVLYTYNTPRDSFVPLEQVNYAHYPAGGLRSSIRDLLRYAQAWLNLGELDGQRFLAEETVQTMLRQQVPDLSARQGLVLRYDVVNGNTYVGHSGAGIGGSANFLMLPGSNAALIVVTNGDAYVRARLGMTAGREAFEAILARMEEELQDRMTP